MEDIAGKIKKLLNTAEGLYHQLVLLVGEPGSGKTAALNSLADELDMQVINVNFELSQALLELSARQRSLRVPQLLRVIIDRYTSPLLLDNLELLFDSTLNLDPLRLLQGISRTRAVVASWNGTMNSGRLLYAETGHPEYRSHDSVDALIVNMDGSDTVDTKNKRKAEQA